MAWDIEKVGDKIKKNPVPYIVGGLVAGVLGFLFWPRSSVSSYDRLPQEASFPPDYSQGSISPGDLSSMFSNLSTMLVDMEARRSDEMAAMTYLQLETLGSMQETTFELFDQFSKSQIDLITRMESQAVQREQQQLSILQQILNVAKEPAVIYQQPTAPASSGGNSVSSQNVVIGNKVYDTSNLTSHAQAVINTPMFAQMSEAAQKSFIEASIHQK